MRLIAAGRRRTIGMPPVLAGVAVVAMVLVASPARADGPGEGAPWIVSVGDSYISGEGGRWAGNSSAPSARTDALGPGAYHDSPGATAELIPGCHRSHSAEVFVGDGVSGLTLACSGAKTRTNTSDGDFKPGLDFHSSGARQGQALMLESFARTHNVKLVPLSIGGNDFDFGEIVAACVENYLTSTFLYRDYCSEHPNVLAHFAHQNVTRVSMNIRTAIGNIRQAMFNAGYADSAYTILVQDYEAVIPRGSGFRYKAFGFERQRVGGCGFWSADADWANDTALPTINRTIREVVAGMQRQNVKLLELAKAFHGHELCAEGVDRLRGGHDDSPATVVSWQEPQAVDRAEWVREIQAFSHARIKQESLHPNYWGQLALRGCIRKAYNGGAPVGGVCTIAHRGLNERGEPKMRLTRRLSHPTQSPGAGNSTGGAPDIGLCHDEAILTGVTLHVDRWARGITGACNALVSHGTSVEIGAAIRSTPRIGHSGSVDATATCPAGMVVTGFSGRSGDRIDAVQLRCSRLNSNGTVGAGSATAIVGGGGGGDFSEKSCAAPAMAVGLSGRAGADLDYLALECSTVS